MYVKKYNKILITIIRIKNMEQKQYNNIIDSIQEKFDEIIYTIM